MGTTLKLDGSGLEKETAALMRKFASLGGDIKVVAERALEAAAKKIHDDTMEALSAPHLPAGGKYSTNPSQTKESVVNETTVQWQGGVASIPIGFDYSKPGAGGYLISGTPRMQPDRALEKIYKRKTYMKKVQDEMAATVLDELMEELEK